MFAHAITIFIIAVTIAALIVYALRNRPAIAEILLYTVVMPPLAHAIIVVFSAFMDVVLSLSGQPSGPPSTFTGSNLSIYAAMVAPALVTGCLAMLARSRDIFKRALFAGLAGYIAGLIFGDFLSGGFPLTFMLRAMIASLWMGAAVFCWGVRELVFMKIGIGEDYR